MENKAVILGTNYYIGLSIIRSLGINGIYTIAVDYTDEGVYASKSKYLKEHLIAPHYRNNPKETVKFLIELAKKEEKKPVLYPTADPYAEFIDDNLNELKEYYLIPMTEQGLWSNVMDKEKLHRMATEHGVLVPETVRLSDENYEDRINEIIGFPCIVKPTDLPSFVSIFRKKIFYCNNMEEVRESIKKARDASLEVIVQRIIPGFDDHMHTFDAYLNQDSKATHWATCRKLRQYPINFGASSYTEQKYVQELYDIGAPFMEAIEYKGFGEIEFKKDAETGKFYLIEINARTTTLDVLLRKAGINFPYVCYRDMIGQPLENKAIKEDTGYVFRYLLEDVLAIRDYTKKGQLTYGQVARSLLRKKAPAVFDLDDMGPALNYFGMLLSKTRNKLTRG